MASLKITNFKVRRRTQAEAAVATKKWASPEFIQSGEYWLATFDLDGVEHKAGIQRGRRAEVAEDMDQFEVQLNVREDAFDKDVFLPEAEVADITKAVGEAFEKRGYWKLP